jgi:hypothetical protein
MFELVHRRTTARVGRFDTAGDALSAYERIRIDDPELASELVLLTPDEADVIGHAALEFGQ